MAGAKCLFAFWLLVFCGHLAADEFTGEIASVTAGDTMQVKMQFKAVPIRLYAIACPKKGQPYGQAARRFSTEQALGKTVTVKAAGTDSDGLTLADVILPDGTSLNQKLLRAGLAWRDKDSSNETLGALEAEARGNKAGLWATPNPTPPWEWHPASAQPVAPSAATEPTQPIGPLPATMPAKTPAGEETPTPARAARPQDAYETRAAALKSDDALGHATLAEWCWSKGMRDEMVKELNLALQADPSQKKIKQIFERMRVAVDGDRIIPGGVEVIKYQVRVLPYAPLPEQRAGTAGPGRPGGQVGRRPGIQAPGPRPGSGGPRARRGPSPANTGNQQLFQHAVTLKVYLCGQRTLAMNDANVSVDVEGRTLRCIGFWLDRKEPPWNGLLQQTSGIESMRALSVWTLAFPESGNPYATLFASSPTTKFESRSYVRPVEVQGQGPGPITVESGVPQSVTFEAGFEGPDIRLNTQTAGEPGSPRAEGTLTINGLTTVPFSVAVTR